MISFREGERVIAVHKRHGFILLIEIAPIIFFACVVSAAVLFGIAQLDEEFMAFEPLILFGAALFLHVLWVALFVVLADFYLDVWVVTSERIIAVEQKGLFSRTVSECELTKVQDMTTDVRGIVATFLNYGNLNIRTASEHEQFIFKQIGGPDAAKDEIAHLCFSYEKSTAVGV